MANDGGIVVALVLLIGAIAFALFSSVATYAAATASAYAGEGERYERKVARLLSGFANVGNAAVHGAFVIFLQASKTSTDPYIVSTLAQGMAPLYILLGINGTVGLLALCGIGGPVPAISWNTFVIVAGVFIPTVWPVFITEGLATWPLIPVVVWLAIFAMELTAVCTSWLWFALRNLPAPPSSSDGKGELM